MDNKSFARIAVWILVAVVLFTVFRQFETNSAQPLDQTSYTQFMDDAKAGKIRKVEVQGRKILVTPQSGAEYAITSPGDLWMVDDLRKNGVQVYGKAEEEPSFLTTLFVSWFPMLLLIGVWIFFMRRMQGGAGGGGAFSFGKSKARMLTEQDNKVRFKDVAGCDEAKEDVQEIVDFLRDPSKYQRLGGRIPRGVQPACATCLKPPRRMLPASSSSTKLMRSAASAAPASAAAMMNASRHSIRCSLKWTASIPAQM